MEEVVNDISVVGRYEEIDGSLNADQQNQHQRYEVSFLKGSKSEYTIVGRFQLKLSNFESVSW